MPTTWSELLAHPRVATLINLALEEDLGTGDVTSRALFTAPASATYALVARTPTVVCGLPLAQALFTRLDPHARVTLEAREGQAVVAGSTLLHVTGDVRAILAAERTVLNFLMRLCGIATATRRAVEALPQGSHAQIFDTRKTLPGHRPLDKAAVRAGGGHNHRMGLYDAVLIKDNHIAAAGSVERAVAQARATAPAGMIVEVEVDTLEQLHQALPASPDIVLLDNFTPALLREAVAIASGRVVLEASGGITLANLPEVAATGVHRISMGSLTHTVQPADLALDAS